MRTDYMSKTVRELADELGVSKQRIQQVVGKLPTSGKPQKQRGRYVIDARSERDIRALIGNGKPSGKQQLCSKFTDKGKQVPDKLFLEMKDRIKNQTEEIKQKNMQLEKMQKLLDQSQQLQLMAEQKLKRLEKPQNGPKSESEAKDDQINNHAPEAPVKAESTPEQSPSFWQRLFGSGK